MKIKKLTSLAVALVLAFAFVGCSKTDAGNNTEDKDNNTTQTQQESSDKEENDKLDSEETEEESIVVYNYDLENEKLIENEVKAKKEDPKVVFEELKNLGVIPKDAKLNSFDVTEANGTKTGLLDVNSAFINNSLGSGAESLMLDAVAQTFIENFDVDQIQLTVDGKDYESGHIVLGEGDYLKPERTGLNQGTGEDVEADKN